MPLEQEYAWMEHALALASTTHPIDVPVAAVIYNQQGDRIAQATNCREQESDPTGHAEIIAIRQAVKCVGDGWRLTGCTMVVTLEPCAMCAGAIVHSRLARLVFGAWEPKTGAVGSVWDVVRDPRVSPRIEVIGGVREAECAQLIQGFFLGQREQKRFTP